jgi:hypothetical protein
MSQVRFIIAGLIAAITTEAAAQPAPPRPPINTLTELFAALEACWVPPPLARARDGMEITVRFSLTRYGKILGQPTITFESRDGSDDDRLAYRKSIADALIRCTPLPITDALGNAIAGRPIAMRFADRRKQRQADAVLPR